MGHDSQTGRTQKPGLFLAKLTEGVLPQTSARSKQESHQRGPASARCGPGAARQGQQDEAPGGQAGQQLVKPGSLPDWLVI